VFDIGQFPDAPGVRFFDKFKHPDYQRFSAFRLIRPPTKQRHSYYTKHGDIVRKHRGNYRKYTVAEKEEAVKQVFRPSIRFWRELTLKKSQKNMVFRVETCSDGRKMDASARKAAVGPRMARCNSPSTPKSMAKSW
jgi:hypothetical protein